MRRFRLVVSGALLVLAGGTVAARTEALPKVRQERPRLFVRAKAWNGPSVERIKGWASRPEYKRPLGMISTCGNSIRYLILADKEAGRKVVAHLSSLKVPTKAGSPSYDGIEVTETALAYDWLRNHPEFKEDGRKRAIAHLEWWGDHFKRYLNPGVVPFYSRNNGALSGLTAAALALHGDSPRAQGYLEHAWK